MVNNRECYLALQSRKYPGWRKKSSCEVTDEIGGSGQLGQLATMPHALELTCILLLSQLCSLKSCTRSRTSALWRSETRRPILVSLRFELLAFSCSRSFSAASSQLYPDPRYPPQCTPQTATAIRVSLGVTVTVDLGYQTTACIGLSQPVGRSLAVRWSSRRSGLWKTWKSGGTGRKHLPRTRHIAPTAYHEPCISHRRPCQDPPVRCPRLRPSRGGA